MARDKKRRTGRAFVAGIIVALVAVLGIGEFGIGSFGGGMISDVFAPKEEAIVEEATDGLYEAEVMVVDNVITLDYKEVTIEQLKSELADAKDKKVLLIDGGATHATWQEVIDALNELDLIVESD